MMSWPSLKIVALTLTVSPRHALTAKRPQSIWGCTFWIWMRSVSTSDKVNILTMWLSRSLGVNLHPTSLPGGRLGPEAYAFVDWVAAAGARDWQGGPPPSPGGRGGPDAAPGGVWGGAGAAGRPPGGA